MLEREGENREKIREIVFEKKEECGCVREKKCVYMYVREKDDREMGTYMYVIEYVLLCERR